jgi:hypothetical protein
MNLIMMRWLIASYIVLVLVFSAKAGATEISNSHAKVNTLNYQADSLEKSTVQDPLPDVDSKSFRQIKFDSNTENFVG